MSLTFDKELNMLDDIVRYINFKFIKSKIYWKLNEDFNFMLVEAAINYLSKFKLIVSLSTSKAEYIAVCKARKKAVWLRYILAKLGFQKWFTPVRLYADNQASIAFSKNPKFHCQT